MTSLVERRQFPVLGSNGAIVDWQFVADHGRQARANHSQSVERLAERGGLSWCELAAVIGDRPWHKMEEADAINAVRAAEAKCLAAITVTNADAIAALTEALTPSADTKAAYIGEFSFAFPDDEGRVMRPTVPWTTIKEIMAAIRARAALSLVKADHQPENQQ